MLKGNRNYLVTWFQLVFTGIGYVLFDLNGTLAVGSYPDWHRVLEDVLGLERRGVERLSLDVFRSVARGRQSLVEALSKAYEIEEKRGFESRALKVYVSGVRLRENAVKVLKRLQGKYELFLCSDTTGPAKVLVRKLKLEKYFSRMFFSCDLGFLKSERGFWVEFLSNFSNASPSEFVMVGDNPRADIYWPKKMGMHTILIESDISSPQDYVAKPKGSAYEKPAYYIKDLEEILNYLP